MHIITLLPALLLLSGCQKEDRIDPPAGNETVTFSGSLASELSRTTLGDTDLDPIPVYWSAGDAIGVFTQTAGAEANNARATLTKGAGEQSGSFTSQGVKMAGTANVFQLYYPYVREAGSGGVPTAESPVRVSGTTLNGLLPAVQEQKAPGVFDHLSRYGYAVATSLPVNQGQEVGFSMTHLLSYLELQLWSSDAGLNAYAIEQIDVQTTGSQPLSGEFQADFEGNLTSGSSVGSKVTLTIRHPEALATGGSQHQRFLFTILPSDLSGEMLTVVVKIRHRTSGVVCSYSKIFDGADFGSATLKKASGDLSTWTYSETLAERLTMLDHLEALEDLAIRWAAANPPTASKWKTNPHYVQWLAAGYLRNLGGYSGTIWGIAAGTVPAEFITYVNSFNGSPDKYGQMRAYFYTSAGANVPGLDAARYGGWTGKTTIDFRHMGATINALIYNFSKTMTELCGWGGDLVTLVKDIKATKDPYTGTGTEDQYAELCKQYVAKAGFFDMDDLLGDIDAVLIVKLMQDQNLTLSGAMRLYYNSPELYQKRFTNYIAAFGTAADAFYNRTVFFSRPGNDLYVRMLYSSGNSPVSDLTTIPDAMGYGIGRGYVEFIQEMAAHE